MVFPSFSTVFVPRTVIAFSCDILACLYLKYLKDNDVVDVTFILSDDDIFGKLTHYYLSKKGTS